MMTPKPQIEIAAARRFRPLYDPARMARPRPHPGAEDERTATLRHDMINCLTALRFRIALLRRDADLKDEHLAALSHVAERIDMLVQEWRQLGEGLMFDARQVLFNLSEMVLKAVDINRAIANLKGQSLTINVEDAPAWVSGSEVGIQRALDNLLSNAVKYTPEGGVIAVTMRVQDGKVHVSVQDNGIGIPDDDQPHVFEAYYRARNAQEHGFAGTGLGLFQVKDAVERHGGRVSLLSQSGSGTRIEIVLPLAEI